MKRQKIKNNTNSDDTDNDVFKKKEKITKKKVAKEKILPVQKQKVLAMRFLSYIIYQSLNNIILLFYNLLQKL